MFQLRRSSHTLIELKITGGGSTFWRYFPHCPFYPSPPPVLSCGSGRGGGWGHGDGTQAAGRFINHTFIMRWWCSFNKTRSKLKRDQVDNDERQSTRSSAPSHTTSGSWQDESPMQTSHKHGNTVYRRGGVCFDGPHGTTDLHSAFDQIEGHHGCVCGAAA